ncbi:Transcriptional regulator, LysR family [hydrothermal vent metagenome]|uniref:Transcriptional regulator, LysR family n=1 Tax=hydrothermal vent metagenome TaxID=652676 RepID=A0A3B0XW33_9ZZZZ
MQQYDLIELRSFMAVVESGGFKRAADILNASTAAISRRVSALERSLDTRLLNRTTRQIDLTEAGKQFYEDLQHIFCALDEAEERLHNEHKTPRGSLRIAAPQSFGTLCFAPVLPDFMNRYPEIEVKLQLDDRLTDIVAEGIDIAIRIGAPKDSSLVASCIAAIPRVFCASPDYLQKHGEPEQPAELAAHNCLHYNQLSMKEEWSYEKKGKMYSFRAGGTLSTNNGEVLRDAAIAGIGITLLPKFIVSDALRTGRLKAVLTDYYPKPFGLYAVRPSRKFTPLRIKRLIEFLQEKFSENAMLKP